MYHILIISRYDEYTKKIIKILTDRYLNVIIFLDNKMINMLEFMKIKNTRLSFSHICAVGNNIISDQDAMPFPKSIINPIPLRPHKYFMEMLKDYDFILFPYGGGGNFECYILISRNSDIIQMINNDYSSHEIKFVNFYEQKLINHNLIGNSIFNISDDDDIICNTKAFVSDLNFSDCILDLLKILKAEYVILNFDDIDDKLERYLDCFNLISTIEPDKDLELFHHLSQMKEMGQISSYQYKKLYLYQSENVNNIINVAKYCADHYIPARYTPYIADIKIIQKLLLESESFYAYSDICHIGSLNNNLPWYLMTRRGNFDIEYGVFITKSQHNKELFMHLCPRISFMI